MSLPGASTQRIGNAVVRGLNTERGKADDEDGAGPENRCSRPDGDHGLMGDRVGRCGGSLVVHGDGSVAFCTAGCHTSGAAQALVTHRRFVPAAALAGAIGADRRFAQALAGRGAPPRRPDGAVPASGRRPPTPIRR